MSFPPPLLPPEDGRSHFRAREPNEGEGHGAEHRDVREHGFRDVGEDIEPNVGEGVDMHTILRGHVVPVGENGEKGDNGQETRGTKERSAGAGRGARGGHGGMLERAAFQTVVLLLRPPGRRFGGVVHYARARRRGLATESRVRSTLTSVTQLLRTHPRARQKGATRTCSGPPKTPPSGSG